MTGMRRNEPRPPTWEEPVWWESPPSVGSLYWPQGWYTCESDTVPQVGGGSHCHSVTDSAGSGFLGAPAPSPDTEARDTGAEEVWPPVCEIWQKIIDSDNTLI